MQVSLHVRGATGVNLTVRVSLNSICALAVLLGLWAPVLAGEPSVGDVASGIERRYNGLATLTVGFEQRIEFGSRPPVREQGTLYLLRPSKMRWDYAQPEGKLLVGDGEVMQMYSPRTNQVRRIKFGATADLRAPLSFLLGRLRLRRQFRNLRLEKQQDHAVLLADGRAGKDAYRQVEFTYDPSDYRLLRIKVRGQDQSITTFDFRDEKVNAPLAAALFQFKAPAGADVLDESFTGGDR